ncbi:hypothetical protein [Capillimicrobium parvum]|uniref:Uncharacterized protein n=1 Tax=Capillimicrobium parvum TaxID=2884022 RepID=A0A9E6XXW7_9ACTN|nr:hypothetical protein [Capillimicrobium parvum]UGS36113.1 hypothetical protein DSM104329_02513 [Capillimicrobium parvum]
MADLPIIRPDATGYTYDGVSVDGFADRPELPDGTRQVIAAMAEAVAPQTLTALQRKLARLRADELANDWLLELLTEDAAQIADADERGDFADLTAEEYRLWRYPGDHPDLPDDAFYPLGIGHAAALAGAKSFVLRRWVDAGIVPAVRVGARYHFFSAGTLQALLLAKRNKQEIAALLKLVKGDDESASWARLIGRTLEVKARTVASYATHTETASDLEAIGGRLVETSDAFAHINMTELAELSDPDEISTAAFSNALATRKKASRELAEY